MTKTTNALDAFLKSDVDIKQEIEVKRLNAKFYISTLSADQLKSARANASDKEGKIDDIKLYEALIAEAAEDGLFNNGDLMLARNASTPAECVSKVLLLGEVTRIGTAVMELSGFDVQAQIDKAKN